MSESESTGMTVENPNIDVLENESELFTREVEISVLRGTSEDHEMHNYTVQADPAMVILDLVFLAQDEQAQDLAVRWNCKAGKCGSCSAEVNGKAKLLCLTKLKAYPHGEVIEIRPMKTFPLIKDLVTDVTWNFNKKKTITPYQPKSDELPVLYQKEVDRVQEFRKCIECFLCQDSCHVLRTHAINDFVGPRFLAHLGNLEMHPFDGDDRIPAIKNEHGLNYCNITRCCTEVCPEGISITDNAIIPLKERVADRYYDPIRWVFRKVFRRN